MCDPKLKARRESDGLEGVHMGVGGVEPLRAAQRGKPGRKEPDYRAQWQAC